MNTPYRTPTTVPPVVEVDEHTCHVTNVAFAVLAMQTRGWKLVDAVHVAPAGTLMQLRFEK